MTAAPPSSRPTAGPGRRPHTAHAFQHLDDYQGPVGTAIARPRLVHAPRPPTHFDPSCRETGVEPWPTADADGWVAYQTSRFADECAWMATQPAVLAYATDYWADRGRLPALGHLHLLYNRGCHAPVSPPDVPQHVDVCSDWCVCECAVTPSSTTPGGGAPPVSGVVMLWAELVAQVAEWRLDLDPADVEVAARVATTTDPSAMALVGDLRAHCCGGAPGATDAERTVRWFRDRSRMVATWVPDVARCCGTNLDAHPWLLQVAACISHEGGD